MNINPSPFFEPGAFVTEESKTKFDEGQLDEISSDDDDLLLGEQKPRYLGSTFQKRSDRYDEPRPFYFMVEDEDEPRIIRRSGDSSWRIFADKPFMYGFSRIKSSWEKVFGTRHRLAKGDIGNVIGNTVLGTIECVPVVGIPFAIADHIYLKKEPLFLPEEIDRMNQYGNTAFDRIMYYGCICTTNTYSCLHDACYGHDKKE